LSHQGLIFPRFSFVAAAIGLIPFILQGQAIAVGQFRRKAKVDYPQSMSSQIFIWREYSEHENQVYAEQAQVKESELHFKFNCAQRE
jgi:hypothetical protein